MEKKSKRRQNKSNQAKTSQQQTSSDSQSATSITSQQFRQAVANGYIKLMEKYLAAGEDINAQGPSSGRTALHQAFRNEQEEAANFLMIQPGANMYIRDNYNVTPANLMLDILKKQPTKTPE